MADIDVTLNYDEKGFKPDPAQFPVRKDQTIAFHLGKNGPPNGKVRITFSNPEFFSQPHFCSGDKDVRVVADLTGPLTYDCELLIGEDTKPVKSERSGGHIIPDNN